VLWVAEIAPLARSVGAYAAVAVLAAVVGGLAFVRLALRIVVRFALGVVLRIATPSFVRAALGFVVRAALIRLCSSPVVGDPVVVDAGVAEEFWAVRAT